MKLTKKYLKTLSREQIIKICEILNISIKCDNYLYFPNTEFENPKDLLLLIYSRCKFRRDEELGLNPIPEV